MRTSFFSTIQLRRLSCAGAAQLFGRLRRDQDQLFDELNHARVVDVDVITDKLLVDVRTMYRLRPAELALRVEPTARTE